MKILRGRESWPLLGISDSLLNELRAKSVAGANPSEMIGWLHAQNVPKPGATLALRLARVMPSAEIKLAVHLHPVYASRRDHDEAFQERVVQLLKADGAQEAA